MTISINLTSLIGRNELSVKSAPDLGRIFLGRNFRKTGFWAGILGICQGFGLDFRNSMKIGRAFGAHYANYNKENRITCGALAIF